MNNLRKLIPLSLLLMAAPALPDIVLEPLSAQSTPRSNGTSSSNPFGLERFDPPSRGNNVCRAPQPQPGTNLVEPDAPAGQIGDGGLPVVGGFRRTVDADVLDNSDTELMNLIAKSPTLQNELQTLKAAGWEFIYTDENSRTSRRDNPLGRRTTIYINNGYNARGTLEALSHEVGHALHTPAPVNLNTPKEEYVQIRLEEEGAAVLNNLRIREEILNNGGPDIHIDCGWPPCDTRYEAIYQQYKVDGDADKARKAIAVLRGPEDAPGGVCYYDSYGNHWDAQPHLPRQPRCPYNL